MSRLSLLNTIKGRSNLCNLSSYGSTRMFSSKRVAFVSLLRALQVEGSILKKHTVDEVLQGS